MTSAWITRSFPRHDGRYGARIVPRGKRGPAGVHQGRVLVGVVFEDKDVAVSAEHAMNGAIDELYETSWQIAFEAVEGVCLGVARTLIASN